MLLDGSGSNGCHPAVLFSLGDRAEEKGNDVVQQKNVMRTTSLVMVIVVVSRVLGFIRQSMTANIYGADRTVDIYFTASDFLIGISGAFTAAMTTVLLSSYIRIKLDKGKAEADKTASKMLTLYFLLGLGLMGLCCLGSGLLAKGLAPKYDAAGTQELAKFLQIYSVAFIFSGFQSIYAAVLRSDDRYVPDHLYGLIYNPLAVLLMMLASERFGIYAVVAAYMISNVIQLVILVCSSGGKVRLTKPAFSPEIRQILIMSVPILLSNVLIQCNYVADKIICNLWGEGMVAAYSYAFTLEQCVDVAFTETVGMVLYSRFSTLAALKDNDNLQKSFQKAVSGLFLILLPVAVITVVGAKDIVGTVYLRGSFTETDAFRTGLALIGFAVGFPLVAIREMFIKVHLAYQNTKLLMYAGAASAGVNILLSIALSALLNRFGCGILGISLATSLSAVLSIALLNRKIKAYFPDFRLSKLSGMFVKAGIAGAVSALAVWCVHRLAVGYLLRFILEAAAGFAVYAAMLFVLRCREAGQAFSELKKSVLKRM